MTYEQIYLAIRKRVLHLLHGRYFVVSRQGSRYLLDIRNYIDRQIEATGGYEKDRIERFLEEMARMECNLFIDIGANLGLYTLAVAKKFPDLDIIAFEPDKINCAQLHANIFLNTIVDRVKVHAVALSDRSGMASFHRHDDENRGRSAVRRDGEIQVPTKTLDSIMTMSGQRVALKIDVEGHEPEVLLGARSLLVNNNCLLQVESFDLSLVEPILSELGYAVKWRIGSDYVFGLRGN